MREKLLPPIHSGEIFREEFMKPLGLSANALDQRVGVQHVSIHEGTSLRPLLYLERGEVSH